MTAYSGPAEALAQFEAVMDAEGVERKGATMPYTSMNGHMFSFLDATGSLALRLPPDLRAEFVATHGARIAVQHGRTMREYVAVPPHLLADTSALRPWVYRSREYVAGLAPKPTSRPKGRR